MDHLANQSQKKWLPIILSIAIFMQMLDATILNTALPSMAKYLHTSPLNMQMIIISYALTLALVMPISGYLADHFGTRIIFLIAIVLFTLGSICCALSQDLNMLIFSRIIQGTGGAMMTPVARLAILKAFDKSEWLSIFNFAIMPALIGPIIGPLLGGYLVEYISWQWIFLINIPIGILGLICGVKFFPNYQTASAKFDLSGYILFALAAFFLTLGLDLAGQSGLNALIIFLLLMSCCLLWLYIRHTQIKKDSLFPANLFYVRTFRIGIIGNLFSRIGISSMPLLLPLMLQVIFFYSPSQAGWMLAPIAIASIVAKPFTQKIIHQYGYRKILIINTALVAIFIAAIAIPSISLPFYYYLPILLCMGFTNSIQFTSMNTITLADLRAYQNSSGNSLLAVNQQLSISFGIAIGASILRFISHQTWLTNGNEHAAFRLTFIILGMITFLSVFIFKLLHEHDGDRLSGRI